MADPWIGLHELAAGEIINKIDDVEAVIAFERTSQRFRDLAKTLLTTVSNPTPIMSPSSILTSFPQIRQMNNVIVKISANDVGLARTMANLVSGNFIFDDIGTLLVFLRSYLRPDEIQGGVSRRPVNDLTLRLVHIQNDRLALMIIIERGKVLLLLNYRIMGRSRAIGLGEMIVPYLDAILPITFTLTHNASSQHPNLIMRKTNNIHSRIDIITPRIYQLLLQGEMGLIDPRSPPGPNNPPLRDSLLFFRTSLGSAFPGTISTLVSIYIFLRTGRTPYFHDPDIQPVINEIFLPEDALQTDRDLENYSDVSFNPDFNDFLSIHPPEDADLMWNEYDNDYRTIRNTSNIYGSLRPGDVIYLSDGRTMQVTNMYMKLSMMPPIILPTVIPVGPLIPTVTVPLTPTVPATFMPVVPATFMPAVPATFMPVVPATPIGPPMPVAPTTFMPVAPTTPIGPPMPVAPTTFMPVAPTTFMPVVPATPIGPPPVFPLIPTSTPSPTVSPPLSPRSLR